MDAGEVRVLGEDPADGARSWKAQLGIVLQSGAGDSQLSVREQLTREAYPFPRLELAPAPSLFDYTYDHFQLLDYRHHPALRAPVAV